VIALQSDGVEPFLSGQGKMGVSPTTLRRRWLVVGWLGKSFIPNQHNSSTIHKTETYAMKER